MVMTAIAYTTYITPRKIGSPSILFVTIWSILSEVESFSFGFFTHFSTTCVIAS